MMRRAVTVSLALAVVVAGFSRTAAACGTTAQTRLSAAAGCCGPSMPGACRTACRTDDQPTRPIVSAVPTQRYSAESHALAASAAPLGMVRLAAASSSTSWVPTTSALAPPPKRYLRACILRL